MAAIHKRFGGEFDGAHVPVVVVGADGVVSYANPAAHRMLRYALGELRGRRLSEIVPTEHWPELHQVQAVFESAASVKLQSQAVRADGRIIDVAMTVEPTSKDAGMVAEVVVSYQPLPPWRASTMPPPPGQMSA